MDLVEALIQTPKDCSDETYLEECWKQVVHTAEQCNIDTEPTPKRQKMQNKRLDGHNVMSQLGGCPEQNKDTFCTDIFHPVLDNILSEINRSTVL